MFTSRERHIGLDLAEIVKVVFAFVLRDRNFFGDVLTVNGKLETPSRTTRSHRSKHRVIARRSHVHRIFQPFICLVVAYDVTRCLLVNIDASAFAIALAAIAFGAAVFGIAIRIRIVPRAVSRFVEVFHFNLARNRPSLAAKRFLRFRFALGSLEFPFQNAHGRVLGALEHEEEFIDNATQAAHFAIVINVVIPATRLSEGAGTGKRTGNAPRVDFNLVAISHACSLHAKILRTVSEIHATDTNPGFLGSKRSQHMHNGLALGPVGTAAYVSLLGAGERLVGIVRVKVLDLFRAFTGEGQLVHLVAIPGEFVDGHASVVFLVRAIGALARLSAGTRMFTCGDQAAVVIHGIPLALKFRKALVVVTTLIMRIGHGTDSRNNRSNERVRARNLVSHAVIDDLRRRIEAQVVLAPLLVDIGGFEGILCTDARQGILVNGNLAVVFGELDDVQVIAIGALTVFTAAENHIARTVFFDKDARVKTVSNAIAATDYARAKGSGDVVHAMGFLDGVGIGAVDACRGKHAHAAGAIGINNVDSAFMDSDAGSPGIVGVIPEFALGAENHAVVGPVLHVLRGERVKPHDVVIVVLLGAVVINIRQDVECITVRCRRGVCQVMIS